MRISVNERVEIDGVGCLWSVTRRVGRRLEYFPPGCWQANKNQCTDLRGDS
jgi:hypothetical protein